MNERGTMRTGQLGSTIHLLRADAETVAQLATVDWSRHFRCQSGQTRILPAGTRRSRSSSSAQS